MATLDEARAAIADGTAASAAGRLAAGLLGADVDAADPVIGDACAEALVAWCVEHGLPYVLRESGRPGGRHVIAVVTGSGVPVRKWARLCRRLAREYGVVVQDRTGQHLRLLTAPHRVGLPSQVIACTADPAQVLDALEITARKRPARRGRRSPARPGRRGGFDLTRSGREYGASCAMARAGYTARQAWQVISQLVGKSAALGERWWRRYMWLSAVTVVAAEQGLDEDAAWELARRACPAACLARGRAWWRDGKWSAAVAEAAVDRPRRYRLDDTDPAAAETELSPEVRAEIAATREGFEAAVAAELGGLHPQRRHSVRAALWALAAAIVTREGSISVRCLAIRARLDGKTVRRALATAVQAGLIVATHAYTGGRADCDAYGPGPAATDHLIAARSTVSPTRCTTPGAHGRASRKRLHAEARAARRTWALRCDALAALAPGERLADSRHPAAKLLRSLHHQRTWWRNLTSDEQHARREARQAHMRRLPVDDRRSWFGWLARRELISNAADRLLTRTAAPDDLETLLAAPLTVHRGMRDPQWAVGGTPAPAAA
ncbi:hypothetical protein [Nocardia wallacei]|uniref:hypothetical protein n=1 Tax=Nocardia wallacei TaxID=480035 RepID=UPI002456AD1D|nr:hypothetical protein [Nocardia wallacei]